LAVAESCKFVYGIDISFRAALIARRVLLGQPEPLNSYRYYREGLAYEERSLSIIPQRNVEILVASGLDLPSLLNFLKFVHCANVVDTVNQPWTLLKQSLGTLKVGGHLLLTDPYFWSPERTPIESWIGVESGQTTAIALREQLEQTCKIVAEIDGVLWVLRVYDRYFTLWFSDCILTQKK